MFSQTFMNEINEKSEGTSFINSKLSNDFYLLIEMFIHVETMF